MQKSPGSRIRWCRLRLALMRRISVWRLVKEKYEKKRRVCNRRIIIWSNAGQSLMRFIADDTGAAICPMLKGRPCSSAPHQENAFVDLQQELPRGRQTREPATGRVM
jgi:hypothetical protein